VGGVSDWGLTVSLPKIKAMAVGVGLKDEDVDTLQVQRGEIEMVDQFVYLGSSLTRDGEVMADVANRIAKASRAFGCLRGPVFSKPILSIPTKRAVYSATVLSVFVALWC